MLRVMRSALAHKPTVCEFHPEYRSSPGCRRGAARAPAAGLLLLLLGMLPLAGCKNNPNQATLAPVKGKVTVDGQAVTSGQVTLLPQAVEKDKETGLSSGQIGSDGTYEIFTGGQAGAPLGLAKLTVSPGMVPQQGAKGPPTGGYNAKYSDPIKTPLTFTVVEKAAPGTYDLKLKK